MAVRGLSEVLPCRLGTVYTTASEGAASAGDEDGRPLNGSWSNRDSFDADPGSTTIGATGLPRTTFYPRATTGAGREIELRFTRYEPELLDLLAEVFSAGAAFDVVLELVDGRTWTGKAKADRREGRSPFDTSNDHQHFGGAGKELVVRLIATEGDWT